MFPESGIEMLDPPVTAQENGNIQMGILQVIQQIFSNLQIHGFTAGADGNVFQPFCPHDQMVVELFTAGIKGMKLDVVVF